MPLGVPDKDQRLLDGDSTLDKRKEPYSAAIFSNHEVSFSKPSRFTFLTVYPMAQEHSDHLHQHN